MDSFEFTKIAGAVLTALLVIFGTKTFIESRQGHSDAKPGYTLPGSEPAAEAKSAADAKTADASKPADAKATEPKAAETKPAEAKPADATPADAAAPAAATPTAAGGADVVALLAKASADNGKTVFSKFKACHNVEKGKAKLIGPNLWGIVDRPKASAEGFEYSPALKAKGGDWTFADLATFITKPSAYVAGTKMVFTGISNRGDVADVIAYLTAQADTPVALPK